MSSPYVKVTIFPHASKIKRFRGKFFDAVHWAIPTRCYNKPFINSLFAYLVKDGDCFSHSFLPHLLQQVGLWVYPIYQAPWLAHFSTMIRALTILLSTLMPGLFLLWGTPRCKSKQHIISCLHSTRSSNPMWVCTF